jgi:hypothetical protein
MAAPHNRVALAAMASKVGCTSPGELLMTPSTSAVAVSEGADLATIDRELPKQVSFFSQRDGEHRPYTGRIYPKASQRIAAPVAFTGSQVECMNERLSAGDPSHR